MPSISTKVTGGFEAKALRDEGLPYDAPEGGRIVSDEITDHGRWSVHHTLIVQFPEQMGTNEAWRFHYSRGATEYQEEQPWDNDTVVTGVLVRSVVKQIEVWESVACADSSGG